MSVGLTMLFIMITYLDTITRSLGQTLPWSWKSETTLIYVVKLPSKVFSFCNQHPFSFGKSRKPLLDEFEGVTLNLDGISADAGIAAVNIRWHS